VARLGQRSPENDMNSEQRTGNAASVTGPGLMRVHASCHCGAIRYEATVDPGATAICHCADCQKLTGSAYRVSVPARGGSFRLLLGAPSVYIKVGDSGARRAQAFCGNCGSPLYTYDADAPQIVGLRVGCIDERASLIPRNQKWCASALAWTDNLANLERRQAE
jgi:hypothetical protein